MKKTTSILIALATVFILTFSGCDKDTFKPGEDDGTHPIVWQYKYDKHQIYSDVIPAMDESGNIFFSIQNGERVKDVYVFATDKDGNALWDKHFSSTNYVEISRIMYIDGKVIFITTVYDDLYEWKETVYCLNANNGTENWQYIPNFETENLITAMAVTSQYVLVSATWGGVYPDIDELHYLSLASGALVKSVDFGDNTVMLISVVGNDVYLGVKSVDIYDFFAPQITKMDLETNQMYWTYTPNYEGDEQNYRFKQRSIPIDANGRAYLIVRKESTADNMNIYIINSDGSIAQTISRPSPNFSDPFNNLLIDKDNNLYTVINAYSKLSSDGSQIWEFYSGTSVQNSSFHSGCILSDNGIVYHAENGGILNVNTIGEIAWAKYDETNFTKPGYPLLTNDGNMVVVGDLYVTCVKGDGAKIQNAPWPRVFQNNGNTSSR